MSPYQNEGWVLSAGEHGYGLHHLAWDDPDHIDLVGFESAFDAFAFLFAHLSIDVSLIEGHKTVGRWWTFKPKPPKEKKEIKVKTPIKRHEEIQGRRDTFQIGMFDE